MYWKKLKDCNLGTIPKKERQRQATKSGRKSKKWKSMW